MISAKRYSASVVWSGMFLACLGGIDRRSLAASPPAAPAANAPVAADGAGLTLFRDTVRPLLSEKCLKCHGGDKIEGGLNLTARESLIKGGETGPAIVPGDAAKSLLYQLVSHTDEPFMPKGGEKLPTEALAKIAAWIDAGAPYDKRLAAGVPTTRLSGAVTAADRRFWSFAPLTTIAPPAVKHAESCRTPVDRFILAKLEAKGLSLSPPVDRRRLIRRVYFDLIGLPPTPAEIAAFVADPADDAYEKLVDRLLASPQYGERWGRHWLDLARYADSNGYETDSDRHNAWRYRDFVIHAWNDDLPYDTFLKWQLAGDEYAPDNPLALAATGFLAAAPMVETKTQLKDELARYRFNELDDMLATTGSTMLGLTIGCARCHDHKFDPIPTRDYYQLLTALVGTKRVDAVLADGAEISQHKRAEAEYAARLAVAENALKNWLDEQKAPLIESLQEEKPGKELHDDDFRPRFSVEQLTQWDEFIAEVEQVKKTAPAPLPAALGLTDASATPEKSYLCKRGDPTLPGDEVQLGFLTVLTGSKSAADYLEQGRRSARRRQPLATTGQRMALAEWLTDVDQGGGRLAARVIVNRLWQHHFGEGLVRTPSDFGAQGDPPSHPELLDYLAGRLIADGWHLKPLQRLLVTSAVYVQEAAFDPAKAAVDPENRLLWHKRPQRLEIEPLRDAILSVSGCLNATMYGPGVKPPIPDEAMLAYNNTDPYPRDAHDNATTWRRSVYLFTKRSVRLPLLETFDGADPSASCSRRIPTTVAPQALAALNDPFIRSRARDFAIRLAREAGDKDAARIELAYNLALGRMPTAREAAAAKQFVDRQTASRAARATGSHPATGDPRLAALTDLCQVLFGLNEFMYVD